MKLREAYHHANQLKALTREVRLHLMSDAIMMHTLITHYYSKTDATMQDEVTNPHEGVVKPASPEILIELYHFLHKQATELQNAISKAKRLCEYDIDVLSANNKTMRECARELTSLARKKPSETTRMQNGRKFNAEGNQVSFVYETKVVSTIDYDRVLAWVRRKIEGNISEYQRIIADGIHAGYFHFSPAEDGWELDDLYVFPEFRSRGIGTAVIRNCCARGSVMLYVFRKNTGALALYRRLGFREAGTAGQTRLILRKE